MRTWLRAVLLAGCGGATALTPHKPDTTYYWKVCSSTVEFDDNCSDEPSFRTATGPLPFEAGSYLIYRTSADARSATMMTCTSLDPKTCMPAANGRVFSVSGAELTYTAEERSPTGFGGCILSTAWSWTLTDWNTRLDAVISGSLSLVDDPPACEQAENTAKSRAPNMKGFQGCTVTFKLATVPPDKNC